jgi:Spy/CpxP family protein refolding chaperone
MNLFNSTGTSARLIGSALLLITFIAGGLAGAATVRVTRADEAPPAPRAPQVRGGLSRLMLDESFAQSLELTAEQRAQIKTIIARRDQEAKKFWNDAEPRLKGLGEQTKSEIHAVLTPAQVEKMEAEMAKRHAAWKERHKCHASDSAKTALPRS